MEGPHIDDRTFLKRGASASSARPCRSIGTAVSSVPIVRHIDEARRWASLTAHDHRSLDRIFRNEADTACRRRARILLDDLGLDDGDHVFDCGCGPGFYLMTMDTLRRLRLTGLDLDPARVREARRQAGGATLIQGAIEHLPVKSETFDKVLMTEVLEHVSDEQAALREVFRVLRPGGVLALSVPNANYPFVWDPIGRVCAALVDRRGGHVHPKSIWWKHERLYQPGDAAKLVAEAGFAIERVEETTHYTFPFLYFIIYHVGKPLFMRHMLPRALRNSADRFRGARNDGSMRNPLNVGRAIFRTVDRLNDWRAVDRKHTFVNVIVKAHKPR